MSGKRAHPSATSRQAAGAQPARPNVIRFATADAAVSRGLALVAKWSPGLTRVLLGVVLAWFGYHELTQPALWTGYVPLVSTTSSLALWLVVAHGWVLAMLAVALVAGIAPRLASVVAGLLLAEIVLDLSVGPGLNDIALRDLGVFGLAVAVAGRERWS